MSQPTSGQPGGVPAGGLAGSQSPAPTPEYGQYAQPEYGQLAAKYPGWDPYVYGKPEPPASAKAAAAGQTAPAAIGWPGGSTAQGSPAAAGGPAAPGQPPLQGQSQPGPTYPGQPTANQPGNNQPGARQPGNWAYFGMQPINLDDPRQNPYYGRWDSWAIISFILSLFSYLFPILPIFLSWFAIRRTRLLHTRGRGLAVAALTISLLALLADLLSLWLGFNPLVALLQLLGFGSVTGGGSSGPVVSTVYQVLTSALV